MTTRARFHRALFLPLLVVSLVGASAALAADQVVPLPERWHAAPEIFAASIENLAVPLQTDDGAAGSRVLQVRGVQVLSTDLHGAVSTLAYSFDGRFLLVHHAALSRAETAQETTGGDSGGAVPIDRPGRAAAHPSGRGAAEASASMPATTARSAEAAPVAARASDANGADGIDGATSAPDTSGGAVEAGPDAGSQRLVSLIAADGAVLWTKADDRRFEFSTTVEVIVASSEEPGTGLRSNIEVFDLKGKSLRTLPVSDYSADGAIVLADGRKAVLVVERSLLCIDFAQDGSVVWRYDLSRSEPDVAKLFSLAPDKIILQLAEGRFKLFQPSGTLSYEYDPATVALAYPELTEAEARQLAPGAGPNACSLTVFSGGPHARQIHLGTSKIFKKYVRLDAPGYKRIDSVIAGKLLFVSPTSLLIRSLKDEFKAPAGDIEL